MKTATSYQKILEERFPQWETIRLADLDACLHAVEDGKADAAILSNFHDNNIFRRCDKMGLTPIATGKSMDYHFASVKGDKDLLSLLNKTVGMVPSAKVNAVLTKYISEKEEEVTFADFIRQHLATVLGIVAGVLALILLLVVRIFMNREKASKSERLIASDETDKLTGVYSKNFLFEYAKRAQYKHTHKPMDAVMIDIDRFHSINVLNGTDFGDKALSTLGGLIKEVFNEPGTIAGRVENDHFCVFRWHKNDDFKDNLNAPQSRMDEQFPNVKIHLRMSVLPNKTKMEPEKMYDRARVACNLSRGQYNKQQLVVYDDSVREKRHYEQRLINDLKNAVKNEEFEVYYQPQYDIQCDPPVLKSAEALLRWRHPELGMIMPGDFIPLFEKHGLIGEVDKCVWKKAAKQVAKWKSIFGKVLPVSVNLSRVDIFDPNLEKTLDGLIQIIYPQYARR